MAQEELSELFQEYFHYDSVSGIMFWKKNKGRAKGGDIVGRRTSDGYLRVKFRGKNYLVHRLAWLLTNGSFPSGEVDHKNHNRLDNRMINLRDVSFILNRKNKGSYKNNTSGVTGVSWSKPNKKWSSYIEVDKKRVNLGFFVEFGEAVNARKNAEVLYGFYITEREG